MAILGYFQSIGPMQKVIKLLLGLEVKSWELGSLERLTCILVIGSELSKL